MVPESGPGMVRSASTSSLKGSEKVKYKNMFKKAVNLVMANTGTGTGFAQKDINLDGNILPLGGKETFQDKAESMQPFSIPKHSNRSVSTISSQGSGDDDSESEEMTLQELKDFIFQCPDDMILGDLKQFILKKEVEQEDKPYLGIARPSSGSLSRARSGTSTSTSGSLTRHRPRSASRARRRSGTGGEAFERADTGLNPAERRSNSAGRRRNSSSLSTSSDHHPRRRRSGSSGDLLSTSNHSMSSISAESRRRRSSRPRRSKTSSSAGSFEVAKDAVRSASSDRRRRNRLSRASSNSSLISSKKGPSPASDDQNRRSSSLRSLVNDIETTDDERIEATRMVKSWSEFEEAPLKSIPLL